MTYYLAKEHSIWNNITVLERAWLGGGSTGRNTEIVRSNYLWDESSLLYEKARKVWETLSQELNFNVMLSKRGVLNPGHSLQDMRDLRRRVNANLLNGIDAALLTPKQVKERVPIISVSATSRYPIPGVSLQSNAGTARHDAIAWGYARAAALYGVDIIQNCEVTGIRRNNGRVEGLETSRGFIKAGKVGLAVAGSMSVMVSAEGCMSSKGQCLPLSTSFRR
jgi:sarcosine oxidase subunit beta